MDKTTQAADRARLRRTRRKLRRLMDGTTAHEIVNDAQLDALFAAPDLTGAEAQAIDRLRTVPNPERVGTLDTYRATLAPA